MNASPWQAGPNWQRIDLLSDVHLHAGARRTFLAWRDHLLTTPADAVLILGDLFEVWIGDDARVGAFEQECVATLRAAARSKLVAFMPGNRDFLLGDAMLGDCSVQRLMDPTLAQAWGQKLLLTHGDALCLEDVDYQRFRSRVRSDEWQRQFLAQTLDARRAQARGMREASAAHQAGRPAAGWADVDAAMAQTWLAAADTRVMVHGHTHKPRQHELPGGRVRHVLGDWDFEATPHRAMALSWTPAGLVSLNLARP